VAKNPIIISVEPKNMKQNVALDTTIIATFSNAIGYFPIDPESANNDTVYLTDTAGNKINSTVVCEGNIVTLTPNNPLSGMTSYKMTIIGDLNTDGISEGIQDISGTPMNSLYTWSFTTVEGTTSAPLLLNPSNTSIVYNTPILKWTNVGADLYTIQISSESNFNNILKELTTIQCEVISSLSLYGTYFWRVKGTKDLVDTNWSGTNSFSYSKTEDEDNFYDDNVLEVIKFTPENGTINFSNLKMITVEFNNNINPDSINSESVLFTKKRND